MSGCGVQFHDASCIIDAASLESSLQELMSPANVFAAQKTCIFKTPNILSRHNPKAYVPDAFSIGPMHHGKPDLKPAERIKSLYLRHFLARFAKKQKQHQLPTSYSPPPPADDDEEDATKFDNATNYNLREIIKFVYELEADARACYAEPWNFSQISSHQLVHILVLDGCFLIELFCKAVAGGGGGGGGGVDGDDPIRTMACMYQYLFHDLILLENQIPWLVLEALYEKTIGSLPGSWQLKELVINFFGRLLSTTNQLQLPNNYNNAHKYQHILDLIRECLISSSSFTERSKKSNRWLRFQSAKALREAGVKLRKSGDKRKSILELTFDKKSGVLEIPPLVINETTEATLRNLISYEQCYPNCQPIATSYVILMDNLIDTSYDLEKLCDKGILENWLDPKEATQMFNKLYNDACVKGFYYIQLCDEVEEYCIKKWHKWRAGYVHNYFSTPWGVVSQVVGTIVLVLTILQTIYTVHRF